MTFFVYNKVRMSRVALMNMRLELPYWGEGIYVYLLLLRVVVALRSSSLEGDITSFPPRMDTVLGVTCFSSLALLTLFACVHTLVIESPILLLPSYSPNL